MPDSRPTTARPPRPRTALRFFAGFAAGVSIGTAAAVVAVAVPRALSLLGG